MTASTTVFRQSVNLAELVRHSDTSNGERSIGEQRANDHAAHCGNQISIGDGAALSHSRCPQACPKQLKFKFGNIGFEGFLMAINVLLMST